MGAGATVAGRGGDVAFGVVNSSSLLLTRSAKMLDHDYLGGMRWLWTLV